MGNEARRRAQSRKDAIGEVLLKEVTRWAFSPSEWERETLAELCKLPRVIVHRPPDEQLLAAGMRPKECHVNCSQQVANDPAGQTRQISGWWVQGPGLVLHSIVEIEGLLLCLTPQMLLSPGSFEFIPDPHIEWRNNGDGSMAGYRLETRIPVGLRKYPDLQIRMKDELLRLIEAGTHPFDAFNRIDQTFGAELEALEPI